MLFSFHCLEGRLEFNMFYLVNHQTCSLTSFQDTWMLLALGATSSPQHLTIKSRSVVLCQYVMLISISISRHPLACMNQRNIRQSAMLQDSVKHSIRWRSLFLSTSSCLFFISVITSLQSAHASFLFLQACILILYGENPVASENLVLGQFDIVNIPPAPKKVPRIEVTFHLDKDLCLTVSARDLSSSRQVEWSQRGDIVVRSA